MLLSYVRKRSKADRPDKEVNLAWEMGIIDKICSTKQDLREVSVYPGKWNDIITRREYFQDFKCNFDLSNYPFDVQTCYMNFTLIGTMDTQVIMREDRIMNLTYLGEKRLVEYQVIFRFLVKYPEINVQHLGREYYIGCSIHNKIWVFNSKCYRNI